MAPKKNKAKESTRPSAAKNVAQVRISTDAEDRLRKLVGDVGKGPAFGGEAIPEGQKKQIEKRLRKIYDDLGNEGFKMEQIELALASIPLNRCTIEAALDWLCLNLPPNELPIKFSGGFTVEDKGGSVQVLASSAEPALTRTKPSTTADDFTGYSKVERKEDTLDQKTDKDWIRQYVAAQEEEESGEDSDWEDLADRSESYLPLPRQQSRKATNPAERAVQIREEFAAAKQAALGAKSRGHKQGQAEAGKLIRALKEEMASLGLNEQELLAESEKMETAEEDPNSRTSNLFEDEDSVAAPVLYDTTGTETAASSGRKEAAADLNAGQDEGLFGMFDEDSHHDQALPTSVVRLQKKEKLVAWGAEPPSKKQLNKQKPKAQTEAEKSPRAILQQFSLKNGWEAPKYQRVVGSSRSYLYAVTIVRPTVGRGKNKKTGGPATYNLPENEEFSSISDAQDAVATWALLSLFPDLPLYRSLLEPFRSMWLRWNEQGESTLEQSSETRDTFIRSLLDAGKPEQSTAVPESDGSVNISEEANKTGSPVLLSRGVPDVVEVSRRLRHLQERKLHNNAYQKMCRARSLLPMAAVKETVIRTIAENDVVVISGETGSGKTTQVPQYILDDMILSGQGGSCNIVCTQPRRIAAISVAERVAAERCEPAPGSFGSLVGYQVRLESSWSSDTRLLFCTTGILLRKLSGDRSLSDISHIVVDEVHERTVLGDFLISLLKDLQKRRKEESLNPLKVILMSATLDAERFSQYFGGCPVIIVKGRTFPVTSYYLEDIYEMLEYRLLSDNPAALRSASTHDKTSARHLVGGRQNLALSGWGDETILDEAAVNPFYDRSLYRDRSESTRANLAKVNEDVIDYELLEDLVMYINDTQEDGALLVFLPGMPEIQQLLDRLSVLKAFSGSASDWLLPLHSSVSPGDQRRVFQIPPKGVRKIVLATNIAETSVTIEDVVHVIDCGKHKENLFDSRRRMTRMTESWISQANARQRRGRAGRVRAGYCFCLYTRHRFEKLMHPFQLPEMLRVPLVELCLQIKLLTVENVASFLGKALDPPKVEAVETALATLREVGALGENEELTHLGHHLAALPVDVHIGKMMLYGVLLGCVSPVLTVAAYLSHKSPFAVPFGQRDAAERAKFAFAGEGGETIASRQQSDHLVIVAAYNGWRRIVAQGGPKAARQFCDTNFLSVPVLNMLREMRMQFARLLRDIGFIRQVGDSDRWLDDINEPFNRNAQCAPVIKSVLCAGLYPNLAAMMEESIAAGHANALNQRAGLASNKQARWSDGHREVFIHPSSVNSKVAEFQHPYLVFHEKVETSRVYLRDTTVLSPFSLLLFGGAIKVQHQAGQVTLDEWMKIDVPARTGVLFRELRLSLDSILEDLTNSPQGLAGTKAKDVVTQILQLLIDVEKPRV